VLGTRRRRAIDGLEEIPVAAKASLDARRALAGLCRVRDDRRTGGGADETATRAASARVRVQGKRGGIEAHESESDSFSFSACSKDSRNV
jgi:hypothetical protein